MFNRYFPIIFSIGLIAVLILLGFLFDLGNRPVWIKEGGIVESLSVLGYCLCVAMMIIKGKLPYLKKYSSLVLLPILFALRELDFDKRFTTMGIFKGKFYFNDAAPIGEKIIGLLVIVLLLFIVYRIITRHGKTFFDGLKHRTPLAYGVLSVLLALIISKFIDGIGRKLSALGITISDQFSGNMELLEEMLELGIPILIMATLVIYFSHKHSS